MTLNPSEIKTLIDLLGQAIEREEQALKSISDVEEMEDILSEITEYKLLLEKLKGE